MPYLLKFLVGALPAHLIQKQDVSTSPSVKDSFIPPDDEQPSTSRSAAERDEVDEDDPDDLSEPTTSSEDKPGALLAKWRRDGSEQGIIIIDFLIHRLLSICIHHCIHIWCIGIADEAFV